MPTWVTTKIHANEDVISALLNDEGDVDFNMILPFPGKSVGDGIYTGAEDAVKIMIKRPLSDHPLIAKMEAVDRKNLDIRKMSEESFEQFVEMLRNYRVYGYLHEMDFAQQIWGTKWNACDCLVDATAGTAEFNTAWYCPLPVLVAVSKTFPTATIDVEYASENIGSNCGRFTLLNGDFTQKDIAPRPDEMLKEQREYWEAFAYGVRGRGPDTDEDNTVASDA